MYKTNICVLGKWEIVTGHISNFSMFDRNNFHLQPTWHICNEYSEPPKKNLDSYCIFRSLNNKNFNSAWKNALECESQYNLPTPWAFVEWPSTQYGILVV